MRQYFGRFEKGIFCKTATHFFAFTGHIWHSMCGRRRRLSTILKAGRKRRFISINMIVQPARPINQELEKYKHTGRCDVTF